MLEETKKFIEQKAAELREDDDLLRQVHARAELSGQVLIEFSKYYEALCVVTKKEGGQRLKDILGILDNQCTEGGANRTPVPLPFDDSVFCAVIELFLAPHYEPPRNLVGIQVHLAVIDAYYRYLVPSMGVLHTSLHDRIDLAFLKLTWHAAVCISAFEKRAHHTDRTRATRATTDVKQKTRRRYVNQELLKLKRENPLIGVFPLEQMAKEVKGRIEADLNRRKIKCGIEILKKDIRENAIYKKWREKEIGKM